MQSTSGEPKWVQLSNVPYARTPMLQNVDRKCIFCRCRTTHGTPRTRPPPHDVLDHTIPKCFFRPFTDRRQPWKNSKIKMVLERIRAHQRLRLPTDWGWRDHYRNQRLQETTGEKCTVKWKITTSTRWVPAPFPPTIGIWVGKKSSTVSGDYIPFLLLVY
jgi:hypothetical protein